MKPGRSRVCIVCGAEFPLVAATLVTCADCRAAKRKRCLQCDAVFTAVARERLCAICHPPFQREVQAFLDYLRVEKNASPNTIVAYGRDLAALCRYLDNHAAGWTWEAMANLTFRGFLSDFTKRRGMGMRSAARATTTVKRFFRYLRVDDDGFPSAPLRGLRTPKFPRPIASFFTMGQTEAVFRHAERAAAGEGYAEVRVLLMIELLYGTGIRLGELVGMDVADLDLNREQVRVLGKGRKERIVPIGSKAMDVLARYFPLREEQLRRWRTPADMDALFFSNQGKRISPRQVQRIVRAAVRAAGVPALRIHAWRHSFSTDLMNAGAGLVEIRDLLGHESVATTSVYLHTALEGIKQQYMKAHPRANWTEPEDATD